MASRLMEVTSNRLVDPFDLKPDDVHIDDIANSLSNICRFNGHTRWHYSVAQHSLLVQDIATRQGHGLLTSIWALLHDAHEAYVGDTIRPIQMGMPPEYLKYMDDLKTSVDTAIIEAFGLTGKITKEVVNAVHEADMMALATEKRDLMGTCEWESPLPSPHHKRIIQLTQESVYRKYKDTLLTCVIRYGEYAHGTT